MQIVPATIRVLDVTGASISVLFEILPSPGKPTPFELISHIANTLEENADVLSASGDLLATFIATAGVQMELPPQPHMQALRVIKLNTYSAFGLMTKRTFDVSIDSNIRVTFETDAPVTLRVELQDIFGVETMLRNDQEFSAGLHSHTFDFNAASGLSTDSIQQIVIYPSPGSDWSGTFIFRRILHMPYEELATETTQWWPSDQLVDMDDEADAFSQISFETDHLNVQEDIGTVQVVLRRSGGVAREARCWVSTSSRSAIAGADFAPLSGWVQFAANQSTNVLSIDIINDDLDESPETFLLQIEQVTSGSSVGISELVVRISVDTTDSSAGIISFRRPYLQTMESSIFVLLRLDRTNGTSGVASVQYTTVDGQAKAGSDYIAASGSVDFDVGQTEADVSIGILSDGVCEFHAENFTVMLESVSTRMPCKQAPTMAPIVEAGAASASKISRQASLAFDSNPSTMWTVPAAQLYEGETYLVYTFRIPVQVAAVRFAMAASTPCPERVAIYGSEDGNRWVWLTTRTSNVCAEHVLPRTFEFMYWRFDYTPVQLTYAGSIVGEPCDGSVGQYISAASESGTVAHTSYGSNEQCQWIVSCRDGETVEISFSSFQTEQGHDYVVIDDMHGLAKEGLRLGRFTGSVDTVSSVESTGSTVRVTLSTDDSLQQSISSPQGNFEATYFCRSHDLTSPEISMFSLSECSNDCPFANDGTCDDGGVDSIYDDCSYASDCTDCGLRPHEPDMDRVLCSDDINSTIAASLGTVKSATVEILGGSNLEFGADGGYWTVPVVKSARYSVFGLSFSPVTVVRPPTVLRLTVRSSVPIANLRVELADEETSTQLSETATVTTEFSTLQFDFSDEKVATEQITGIHMFVDPGLDSSWSGTVTFAFASISSSASPGTNLLDSAIWWPMEHTHTSAMQRPDVMAGSLSFDANVVVADESSDVEITILRQRGTVGTVQVLYRTVDGTAIAGFDYEAVFGSLTFLDGESSKNM
eukprot:SAG31_NODE_587_length_13828_cov_2.438779_5_plen_990_part_00